MKKVKLLILLASLAVLSGCNDEDARLYAQKLKQVLTAYQVQLNDKIAAEKRAYRQLAAISARVGEEDIIETLHIEREERARRIAEGLLKDPGPLMRSEIHAKLQDYAALDFNQTRDLLERESAAVSQYLQDLESLEVDTKKVKALGESLDDLGKEKGRLRRLKQLADFVEKVDVEYDKLVCVDLVRELACLKKKLDATTDATQKAALKEQIAQLEERIKLRKDAQPRRCPADDELNKIDCPSK
jgi:hypothetical protein